MRPTKVKKSSTLQVIIIKNKINIDFTQHQVVIMYQKTFINSYNGLVSINRERQSW